MCRIRPGPGWSMLSCPSLKTADGASFTSPDHMLSDNDDGFGQNEGQSQRSMFLCVCVGSPSHNLVPGVEERFGKTAVSIKFLNSPL